MSALQRYGNGFVCRRDVMYVSAATLRKRGLMCRRDVMYVTAATLRKRSHVSS